MPRNRISTRCPSPLFIEANDRDPPAASYDWLGVGLCFALLFIATGAQMALAVLLVPMSREFNTNVSGLAFAGTMSMLVTALSLPIVGKLADRFGSRAIILVGASIAGTSALLLGLTSSIWQIYLLYGISFGLTSSSSAMLASTALISRSFTQKKSMALTIFQSAYPLGWLFMVPLTENLRQIFGWRSSWLALGTAYLIVVLTMRLLLKEPYKNDFRVDLRTTSIPLKRAMRTSFFLTIGIVVYFICGFTDVPFVMLWIPVSLEWGITETIASYTLGFMAVVIFLGTIVIGLLPARFGKKRTFALSYVIRTVALGLPLVLRSTMTYYAFTFLMAFGFYGMSPVISAWLGEVFGEKSIGSLFGFSLFMHYIGTAIGIYIFGLLADVYRTYYPTFMLGFILALTCVVLSLLVRIQPSKTVCDLNLL